MHFPLDDRKFYRYNLIGLTLLGLLLFLFWRFPRLDFWISDLFFDPATQSFVNDHHWFWQGVMHEGVRKIMKVTHLVAAIVWIATFKVVRLRPYRRALGYFLVASLLASTIVGLLKDNSDRACPFHMVEYGGKYQFVPFFSGVAEAPGIHCWPGGHILHALALLPIPFALRGLGLMSAARYGFYLVAGWGLLLNHTQLLRGQHFISHHLWTLMICWVISYSLYRLYRKRHRP